MRLNSWKVVAPILGLLAISTASPAQTTAGRLHVHVVSDSAAVAAAAVYAGLVQAYTNADGTANLTPSPGATLVVVTKIGFRPESVTVQVRAERDTSIEMRLVPQATAVAPVLVTTARIERRLEDEPLRIEVLSGDDVGEKSEMRPADSRSLLSEMSGVRMQPTSPLGATNIRIQGLPGRYTAMLNDGLPLYGGQVSSFSLVDVVPLDLRQVEVIKGSASALYGSQALGGVVNLISRRPPDTSEVLVNQGAPSTTDAMAFLASSLNPSLGLTVLGGLHRQSIVDENKDGWADVPGLRRAEVRPRLFFGDSAGHSLMVTAGGFLEDREAGTVGPIAATVGPRTPFVDSLAAQHGDVGVVGQWRVSPALSFGARASATAEDRQHQFGSIDEHDGRRSAFGELSGTEVAGHHVFVGGVAWQRDQYDNTAVPQFNAVHSTPGVFFQDTYSPLPWLSGTANGRCDHSNVYGTICTPRLSVLTRAGSAFSARASAGSGWFAPQPLTDETEAFGLSRVVVPRPLAAEHAQSASIDLTATRGPLQVNGTLFANRVSSPVGLRQVAGDTTGLVDVINASGPLETRGGELFAVFNQEPVVATAYYATTWSRWVSTENGQAQELPLTPRQAAGIDFALEDDESGASAAIELFYTGRQVLAEDPSLSVSPPYTTVGVLLSARWRGATLFINGENLTDVRQTQFEPFVRTQIGEGGRWTVDQWAPLEGRKLNVGARWQW